MKQHRIPTIRSTLAWLVVACLIPASLMAAALISYNYQQERARLARDAIATARALTSVLDRELAGVQSALYALGTSPHLASGNFRAFYGQAKETLPNLIATNIVLIDRRDQQLLNTYRPFGHPLPNYQAEQLKGIFKTGRPAVTDLFPGPVIGSPVLAIGVPVIRRNRVVYSLNAGLEPKRLSLILTQQRLPPEWITGIFDRTGTIVARTHDMDRFLGRKGSPALVKHITEVSEDAFESATLEGIPVLTAFSRSAVSNWTVAIGIPLQTLNNGLQRSLAWLVLGLMLLLACSLALAWYIAGRISRSIQGLSAPALALGLGHAVRVPPLQLKEVDEVGQALLDASRLLQKAQHRSQHDALTGLANRILLKDILDHHLTICRRTGAELSVLYVDLDGFKVINDTRGHAAGDELLRAVATRLKSGIRSSDLAARLGGDEFVVVLVNTGVGEAATLAAKLGESIAMPYRIGGAVLAITASIGIAGYPGSGASSDELLSSADHAMYEVKSARRRQPAAGGAV
jgi:diguanylate cyclase (GGDEF)-like protein